MTDLAQYAPGYYAEIEEFDALFETENELFNEAEAAIASVYANSFVLTAEEAGIAEYERQLRIIANPSTEGLEERRGRIMNRLSMRPPLTMKFLRQRLDDLIGPNAYILSVDYDAYTLTLQSSAVNQFWFEEIKVTINSVKPVNIVFKNIPTLTEDVLVSEAISAQPILYNYRAGTTARTSLTTPIGSLGTSKTLKGADQMSIEPILIERISDRISNEIDSILLNDIYEAAITKKVVDQGVVHIEYAVPMDSGLSYVTNVKTKNANGDTLTNAAVYYAVTADITVKHDFVTKEGA